MTWNQKVVWYEGMFLRPQHFQQQDRYFEALIEARCQPLHPYAWGVSELQLDRSNLAAGRGRIAIARARGLLPDGTPFDIPDHDDPPPPLIVEADLRDSTVLLALPRKRLGMPDIARQADRSARYYTQICEEVRDNILGVEQQPSPIEIGKRQWRLLVDRHDLSDYSTLAIARVIEKLPDQTVVLDEEHIPPCLDCRAIPLLRGYITEVLGLLHQRGEALAERLGDPTVGRGGVEVAQFLRLQAVNRFEPLLAQMAGMTGLHPWIFHQVAVQIAGEMATFTGKPKRRPLTFPPYQQEDLRATFTPLMAELRRSLSLVEEQVAIQIPLEERAYGIRVAVITQRERPLLANATFILAVRADMPADALRGRFPGLVKVGPVERIAQLVNNLLPGIGLESLPVAPREIPYQADFVYFRLDRSSEFWKLLPQSGGIAFHIGGDFPGLELVFWAIKPYA